LTRASAVAIGLVVVSAAVLVAPAMAAGPTTTPTHGAAAEAVRWGLVFGLAAMGIATLIFGLVGSSLRGLVIGQDNRLSTSKAIAAIWTFVVGAALLALVYAELRNHPHPLDATNKSGVIGQYALLFGGPLGAAILAKVIVNSQVDKNPAAKTLADKPSAADLVAGDAGNTDLGDFQYVIFNLVALVYVLGTLLHNPANGLPHIPDVLLGLTSVSAVGYVGKKALNPLTATIKLSPDKGAAETDVTIALAGITPQDDPNARLWVRFGDKDPGVLVAVSVSEGAATLKVKAPNLGIEKATVKVSVVTATGTLVSTDYTYV
jgi:hypothetical protein